MQIEIFLDDKKDELNDILESLKFVGLWEYFYVRKGDENLEIVNNEGYWNVGYSFSKGGDLFPYLDKKERDIEFVKEVITKFFMGKEWKSMCDFKDLTYNSKVDGAWEQIEEELNNPPDLENFKNTFSKSLKFVNECGDYKKLLYALERAGEVFMGYDNYKKALYYFKKYIEKAKDGGMDVPDYIKKDKDECESKIGK